MLLNIIIWIYQSFFYCIVYNYPPHSAIWQASPTSFHFHQLRRTYTSNLLSNGAAPMDVQELFGHPDVSTTMNVYAHSTRKDKRESARLLDKVAGND